MKKKDLLLLYKKARHALIQRRSEARKKGLKIPDLPSIPKRITEASIRRLQKIGITKPSLKKLRNVTKVTTPVTKPTKSTVDFYKISLDGIYRMLNEIPTAMTSEQTFFNPRSRKHGGRSLADSNASRIIAIIDDARAKYGDEEVFNRLQKVFGENIKYELERLAYGMYDKEYSRWGGGGFNSKMTQLRAELM